MSGRLSTWEQSLADYLAPLMHDAVFAWGADRGVRRDCALFAAGAVLAMTGVDFAAAYRGRYATAIGSARALSKFGTGTLEATLDAAFPVRAVGHARRGDLVMHEGAIGICIGADGLFMPIEGTEPGLVRVPRHLWAKAWTV